MRFQDSETQRLLRDTARSYFRDKYPWERLYGIERGDASISRADAREYADLGWLGLLVPESEGGAGASLLDAAVVVEEQGYGGVPAPVPAALAASHVLAAAPAAGDAARTHLRHLASGDQLYTVCEAARGRAPLRTWRDGSWQPLELSGDRLSGTLPLVPFAELADFVVGPWLVEGRPAFGVLPLAEASREPAELLDRSVVCNVHFDGAALGEGAVLAVGEEARVLQERCDALVTALYNVELAGLMQRTLEMTSEYIATRVQFGRPIATFQAARHRASEMLMRTEATRWAAYHSLWSFAQGPDQTEGIWMTKQWAAGAAQVIYTNAHMLHGGIGVGVEYPLHVLTQALMTLAVRGGDRVELGDRNFQSLGLPVLAGLG